MFTEDRTPKPADPKAPTDKKDTAPDKDETPYKFKDWASI